MKIPQHLLRSLAFGLGAVSIAALSGCEPKSAAPTRPTGCWEPVPPLPSAPLPVSSVGGDVVGTGAPAPFEPTPTDPCPPCGRG